ncbi:MAG TPA: DUF3524 domain-containing protein [candidate division Zixibacteria bacterium]|nr:DUF3524 domain-containing protein [candidate division Zixibacteria bacterium]MDD4916969.1 DUF3524 domain-containing protein [candidate division Zixibacteria bacterium]MDM7974171.1 DUF3524 domain-containing protein [candidate division Zixibacteria bacterium]HOD67351.1 DUF3524 domain-containing protein [candidate division Zixibacteria bacterium]HPM36324.1 DUF3524 domain-containing protein [candidate division Zixibacteria bacterium]
MHLLALEPYYAGSHRAFVDGWIAGSRHRWTLLTLPGYKWKWRMRHAPLTFCDEIAARRRDGERWDGLFATDMVDLAQLLGLARAALGNLPAVVYFHENQLTYPSLHAGERDYHFAMTNFSTAAVAAGVWFNSDFHRREFLEGLRSFFRRMPDYPPLAWVDRIAARSEVYPQGIAPPRPLSARPPGPLRILWAARWEHDKNPEDFFAAMRALRSRGVDFRLSVIGEQFSEVPAAFAEARREFAPLIDRWGYQPDRADYERALSAADLIVSTARHEFFGVAIVEAVAAGIRPVLPQRLAYPEIFPPQSFPDWYYDGTVAGLVDKLVMLARRFAETGSLRSPSLPAGASAAERFFWPVLAPRLDDALEAALRR